MVGGLKGGCTPISTIQKNFLKLQNLKNYKISKITKKIFAKKFFKIFSRISIVFISIV